MYPVKLMMETWTNFSNTKISNAHKKAELTKYIGVQTKLERETPQGTKLPVIDRAALVRMVKLGTEDTFVDYGEVIISSIH